MNDDQRQLEEQRNYADRRLAEAEPARIASLGAIAVEWVQNVAEFKDAEDRERELRRELNSLTERRNRLNKQGAALEAAYRSLIGQSEQMFSAQHMATEMRGMAEWARKTLAQREGGK